MISLKKIIILTFLPLITFSLNSCGSLPGGDARKYPPDPKLRVAKNIEEGRGFRLMDKNMQSRLPLNLQVHVPVESHT